MLERHAALLRCPSCGSGLRMGDVLERDDEHVRWGSLVCECRRNHPVLDGIVLIAHPDDSRAEEANSCLRARSRSHLSCWLADAMTRWSPELPRLADTAPGCQALIDAKGGRFYEYLAYRTGTRSYATGMALIAQCDDGVCVDVGAGIGHLAFVYKQRHGCRTLVAIEYCFRLLHIGRQLGFLPNDALCVCADANVGLPTADRSAATVMISDGLHYFRDQPRLVREAYRVLKGAGALLLNHLHNAKCPELEPAQGFSRTPDEYLDMIESAGFDSVQPFSDDRIIDAIASGDRIVQPEYTALSRLRTLSVIARHRNANASTAMELTSHVSWCAGGLNPIYQVAPEEPTKARLSWPSSYFKAEHRSRLSMDEVELGPSGNEAMRSELIRKLVWTVTPVGFLP